VTVVGCINAVGQALPPFVIFDAKNLNMDWTQEEVPGTYQDDVKMGNGAEWIKCACGQWLHEECVKNTATDVNGKPGP